MKEKYQMHSNNKIRMPATYCDSMHVVKSFSNPLQLSLNKEWQIQSYKARSAFSVTRTLRAVQMAG